MPETVILSTIMPKYHCAAMICCF